MCRSLTRMVKEQKGNQLNKENPIQSSGAPSVAGSSTPPGDVPEGPRPEQGQEGGGEPAWPVAAWNWRDSWSWNWGYYNSWDWSQSRWSQSRSNLSHDLEQDEDEMTHILPDAVLGWVFAGEVRFGHVGEECHPGGDQGQLHTVRS